MTGRHNVQHYGPYIAVAMGMNSKDIWAALPQCKTIWGRSQLILHESGAKIIFDGYNANPQSMEAMLKGLFELDRKSGKNM
ncbi:MAG: hypothetical protein R2827_09705 [Bdellovibrionales bacterium]